MDDPRGRHQQKNINRRVAFASLLSAAKSSCFGTEVRPTRLRSTLKFVKNLRRTIGDFAYDAARFILYSSSFHYPNRENLASRIMATCHNVERGLALPDPRPGFGAKNIAYLLTAIDEYIRRFGTDSSLKPSTGALAAYVRFNDTNGLPDCPHRAAIENLLERLRPVYSESDGGTIAVSRDDVYRAVSNVSAEFFNTRHSIRQFSEKEVSAASIDTAIALAQRAPAVCNRQECFVHVIHDKRLILKALDIQGSRGFNHQINKLLVVTNRLTAFSGTGERNQCWIDGGLFAMSLVLGLHSQGLGTCCLNWSKSAPQDRMMRRLLPVNTHEAIIMLVAVGHIPEPLLVARSFRRPLSSARRHIRDQSELGEPSE